MTLLTPTVVKLNLPKRGFGYEMYLLGFIEFILLLATKIITSRNQFKYDL
jgi:hypothetical protein